MSWRYKGEEKLQTENEGKWDTEIKKTDKSVNKLIVRPYISRFSLFNDESNVIDNFLYRYKRY